MARQQSPAEKQNQQRGGPPAWASSSNSRKGVGGEKPGTCTLGPGKSNGKQASQPVQSWRRTGKEEGNGLEYSVPHHPQFGLVLPHPHSWGGGRAQRERPCASLFRGGVVVPGDRKRGRSCFPSQPTPTSAPGTQPTGWCGGREDRSGREALEPAWGVVGQDEALPQEGPPGPEGPRSTLPREKLPATLPPGKFVWVIFSSRR